MAAKKPRAIKNQALRGEMEALGFRVDCYKNPEKGQGEGENVVSLASGMGGVLRMIDAVRAGALSNIGNQSKTLGYFTESPHEDGYERRESFSGGTVSMLERDLAGGIDMAPFKAQKEKLARSGLQEKLQTKIANVVPRRRRAMSEHDGEWDFGRRWDLKPFAATQKALSSGRIVDVICHFAVNCKAKAHDINSYGAMAWAISDLIETCGVATRIVCSYSVRGVDSEKQVNSQIEIEIKKAGQYIAPNMVAAAFQANFFRRAVFGLLTLSCDLQNQGVSYGLGWPNEDFPRLKYSDGKLEMSTHVTYAGTEELEAAIIETVTGKKASDAA